MNELTLNSICGLMNQLYDITPMLTQSKPTLIDNYFNINNLFWWEFLSMPNIMTVLKRFSGSTDCCALQSGPYKAIRENTDLFLNQLLWAKENVHRIDLSIKNFFSSIETIQLFCDIYSHLFTKPYKLTIDEGFARSQLSAKELNEDALIPFCNPYLSFLEEKVMPVIIEHSPTILWMSGRPNIASFAIAKLVKEKLPACNIFVIGHSSEYFSLNKIVHLLKKNEPFFATFDCVLLDDSAVTKKAVRQHVEKNISLSDVPNLIYIDRKSGEIIQTGAYRRPTVTVCNAIDAHSVVDIKLFPKNICYWNQCTFCGINKKYQNVNQTQEWSLEDTEEILAQLSYKGSKYFWAIDEAIPPQPLLEVCKLIIERHYQFNWQVRSRIEPAYMEDSALKLMAAAGISELRLGLESASERILSLMHKTEYDDFISVAETIVLKCSRYGIRVHFPVIIGFPTETDSDRVKTATFLRYLADNYSNFSYNVNLLGVDVSSSLYKNWEIYGITELYYPCAPEHFLGNLVGWTSSFVPAKNDLLIEEQRNMMLYQYDWYPKSARTKIEIFYRLCENTRRSLCQDHSKRSSTESFELSKRYRLAECVALSEQGNGKWLLYHFGNHHYIEGGNLLKEVIQVFSKECTLRILWKDASEPTRKQLLELANLLVRFGIVKEVN